MVPDDFLPCQTGNVVEDVGTSIPGDPGDCDLVVNFESWGTATAVVAQHYPWKSRVRVIVPISDEAPCVGGDQCDSTEGSADDDAITNAFTVARANTVVVYPITGLESEACVKTYANRLADETRCTGSTGACTAQIPAYHVDDSTYVQNGTLLRNAINDLGPRCPCPWDIAPPVEDGGGNGEVGFADLTQLLFLYNAVCPGAPGCRGDFDFNGSVGFGDLTPLLLHWGPCPGGSAQAAGGSAGGGEQPENGANANGGGEPDMPNSVPYGAAMAWLIVGGEQGLLDGSITAAEVAECMDQPTPGLRVSALMSLLAQD